MRAEENKPPNAKPASSDPQQLSRYSYALNNPLRRTDPSGHASPKVDTPVDESELISKGVHIKVTVPRSLGGGTVELSVVPDDQGGIKFKAVFAKVRRTPDRLSSAIVSAYLSLNDDIDFRQQLYNAALAARNMASNSNDPRVRGKAAEFHFLMVALERMGIRYPEPSDTGDFSIASGLYGKSFTLSSIMRPEPSKAMLVPVGLSGMTRDSASGQGITRKLESPGGMLSER